MHSLLTTVPRRRVLLPGVEPGHQPSDGWVCPPARAWCPQRDSNPHCQLRRLACSPLHNAGKQLGVAMTPGNAALPRGVEPRPLA